MAASSKQWALARSSAARRCASACGICERQAVVRSVDRRVLIGQWRARTGGIVQRCAVVCSVAQRCALCRQRQSAVWSCLRRRSSSGVSGCCGWPLHPLGLRRSDGMSSCCVWRLQPADWAHVLLCGPRLLPSHALRAWLAIGPNALWARACY